MIKAPIDLQDLRRRIYVKAKSEPSWRFWGLYVHVCKPETLHEAFRLARENNGAPGIDGVTFDSIEAQGVGAFIEEIRKALVEHAYVPQRVRKVAIPKDGGKKVRVLSVPTIRDRVVQGALKLVLEPIFEADFQPGSFGYRPRKSAHEAVHRVAEAILLGKTYVIDLDLQSYFDNIQHQFVLGQVAKRVNDDDVLRLLKQILRASGKQGVPQGGVISPLISNLYLNEVDQMLEKAVRVTRQGPWTRVAYARYSDDLVVLVDGHPRHYWLREAIIKRLREELAKVRVEVNEEKSRVVDLVKGESFGFLGFHFLRVHTRKGKWLPLRRPQGKKRTALLLKLKSEFRRLRSQPIRTVIARINPILRGWVNYFSVGHSSRCFSFIQNWVEKKLRRHLAKARKRQGFGWKRWSRRWFYETLGLFGDYRVRYYHPSSKASPAR